VRVAAAAVVFLVALAVVAAGAAIAFHAGGSAVGGLVIVALWAIDAAVLSRIARDNDGRQRLWTILALLVGPLVALWLSWKVAPRALAATGRDRS